jgi:tetratricopeptide (TPR) repeat protein
MVWNQAQKGNFSVATAGRQPVFGLTVNMIQERPITGRGLNSFGEEFFFYKAQSDAGRATRLLDQPGAFRHTHNEYLQVWAELGLPGILVFLILFTIPLLQSIRILRIEQDETRSYWVAVLTIGLIFVGIDCLAFFPLHVSVAATYIVFLLACLRRLQDQREEGRHELTLGPGAKSLAVAALLGALAVTAIYVETKRWNANRQLQVAAFLLERASVGSYTADQKRVFADEAMSRLTEIQAFSPIMPEVDNLCGSALMTLGRFLEAVESYQKAANRIPSPEVFTNLAAAQIASNKFGPARESLTLALNYNPGYRKAREARRYLREAREAEKAKKARKTGRTGNNRKSGRAGKARQ